MTPKEFEDTLDQLTYYVVKYKEMEVLEGNELNHILQKITSILYTLENVRSYAHDEFEKTVHEGVKKGNSVSMSVNFANVKVKELYMMRRIMTAAYEVVGAIRSNISWLKTERNSI